MVLIISLDTLCDNQLDIVQDIVFLLYKAEKNQSQHNYHYL